MKNRRMKNLTLKVAIEGTPALLDLITQASKSQTKGPIDPMLKSVLTNSLDAKTFIETLQKNEPQPLDKFAKKYKMPLYNLSDKKTQISKGDIDVLIDTLDECTKELGDIVKGLNELKEMFFQSKEML